MGVLSLFQCTLSLQSLAEGLFGSLGVAELSCRTALGSESRLSFTLRQVLALAWLRESPNGKSVGPRA